ncbi:hypothetical protein OIU84_009308 [Salix udensis]|uniref:Uncharacterized protein n=1 Tax=Salix udensis TaxID=889485 RepID=A0AAD6JR75_9ROSI|nr:hypothetical protein OIU84_009308 [Salix udensis]
MFGAFIGLGAMVLKWHKRPQDWQKRNSFSSWLLPVHAGDQSFMTSKTSMGSHKTNFYSSTLGLGRFFSLSELQEATNNFDSSEIIGVGDEDESKISATVADSPAIVPTPDAISTSVAEDNKSPAEAQVIDEHSGTAMFAQFSGLNGR